MIDMQVRIHDRFSIEFKVGFVVRRKVNLNDFMINMWMFIPNSLDINSATYSKDQFYRDVKSNVRLITPIYLLREIAGGSAVPITNLKQAFENLAKEPTRTNATEYEYQIKMFTAIFKSALRDEVRHIQANYNHKDIEYMCSSLVENVKNITARYRELRLVINVPTVNATVQNYFQFADEFMSNIIEFTLFRLINTFEISSKTKYKEQIRILSDLVKSEIEYKKESGYLVIDREDPMKNRALIFRHGILKKYIESDLFLSAKKRRDGVWVEQIYYSLAAGISMIFATTIAFSFQQKYGNFTMPLFVALVISYMLKDRIKDLMRYYFAHRLGTKYFDNKTTISIKEEEIGWSKEGMDFISDSKVPQDVMELRSRTPLLAAENRFHDEKIILYRKMVRIDRDNIESNSEYPIVGVNDIMRLHMNNFIQKMDNPDVPLYQFDDNGETMVTTGEKVYYLNLVMQFVHDSQREYKRFRVIFSRSGIIDLEEIVTSAKSV